MEPSADKHNGHLISSMAENPVLPDISAADIKAVNEGYERFLLTGRFVGDIGNRTNVARKSRPWAHILNMVGFKNDEVLEEK
jgi:hypothetical protein